MLEWSSMCADAAGPLRSIAHATPFIAFVCQNHSEVAAQSALVGRAMVLTGETLRDRTVQRLWNAKDRPCIGHAPHAPHDARPRHDPMQKAIPCKQT